MDIDVSYFDEKLELVERVYLNSQFMSQGTVEDSEWSEGKTQKRFRYCKQFNPAFNGWPKCQLGIFWHFGRVLENRILMLLLCSVLAVFGCMFYKMVLIWYFQKISNYAGRLLICQRTWMV